VYREEGVDTAVAILYRDDTTPRDPWWAMDDYHNVPVWLPSWEVDRQVAFFQQRPIEVISVRNTAVRPRRRAIVKRAPADWSPLQEQKIRSLFANSAPKIAPNARPGRSLRVAKRTNRWRPPPRTPAMKRPPATARRRSYRSVHGTVFDAGSSVDRQKMVALPGSY